MVKYLPRFGHQVTVLTHSYTRHEFGNPAEIRIYDLSHNTQRAGTHQLLWICLRGWTEFLNICGRYHSIYSSWKKAVIRHSKTILAQSKPDIILATYPPVEDLEIGISLSKRYHVPLLADFRDGLLFEPIENKRINQYPCIRREYARIERSVVQCSSAIITVSPPITEYFINTYQQHGVFTIPNGFDEEDFNHIDRSIHLDTEKFNIVHTGRFGGSYAGRNIAAFVNALRRLSSNHSGLSKKLRLHFIGHLEKKELALMKDLIKENLVIYHGLLDRPAALAFQLQADLLLLLTAVDRKSMITAKLLEYLWAKKPILALTSHTYAEKIIHLTGTGWTVHPHDEKKIYHLLYNIMFDTSFYHALTPSEEEISTFSRYKQIKKLSTLLDTLPY
jgi:glycosyltransferase involved in cell wall biosynthesis